MNDWQAKACYAKGQTLSAKKLSTKDKLPADSTIAPVANGDITAQHVATILEAAHGRIIVVVGDLMLDEWIIGQALRMSPEAPVPVVRLTERRTAPGGAANVAMNLLRLGARVRVCGVVGDDEAGADLKRELQEAGAETTAIICDSDRPTTLKTRVVAQRQQMMRIDRESDLPLSQRVLKELQERLHSEWDGAAALCLSDYDKGLAMCGALNTAVSEARRHGLRITGGPKPLNLACFAGADFLSLNQKEASEAAGIKLDTIEGVEAAGEGLRRQSNVQALAITRGSRGLTLFQKGKPPHHIKAHEVEVFDVAGAGDTFLAAATIGLAGGAEFDLASQLGNIAAAASVRHTGVVAVTPDEVRRVAEEPLPGTQ
jgi:D-beta-D-heptose 7-phosphate kinase/D-beta-D-heptose 1-phosphate adenosyltransferase